MPSPLQTPWISRGWTPAVCGVTKPYVLYKKRLTTPTSYMNACVSIVCCCSVIKPCPILHNPWTTSMPDFPVPHHLPEFAKVHVHCISDAIQPSHSLLPSSSIFPSISVFSNESALCIRQSKYWSFSFSMSPFNEYLGLFPLGLTSLISLLSKRFSRVFSSSTVGKHQFFSTFSSLSSNLHNCTRLLEKPQPWLYIPLLAK